MFITESPIPLPEFLAEEPGGSSGAAASFVGVVRNHDHGKGVKELYYECYVSMAEKEIQGIVEDTKSICKVDEVKVLHRVGRLTVGEAALAVWVSAAHRQEAFAACRYVVEEIKKKVPIWKRQFFEDGTEEWVCCAAA